MGGQSRTTDILGGRNRERVLTARRIYLDYNASTPIDPAVAAAMLPLLDEHFGNPSSGHWASTGAKAVLETARSQVAALLGCHSDEVVFTSGGSEANNLALKGIFFKLREKGDHIITTKIEHPAIVEPCRFLERLGAQTTFLPVDGTGRIDPDDLRKAITPRTILLMSTTYCFTLMRRNPSARFRPT